MEFRDRLLVLIILGFTFSATIIATQVAPLIGGIVGMLGVVANYWVMLRMINQTIRHHTLTA